MSRKAKDPFGSKASLYFQDVTEPRSTLLLYYIFPTANNPEFKKCEQQGD